MRPEDDSSARLAGAARDMDCMPTITETPLSESPLPEGVHVDGAPNPSTFSRESESPAGTGFNHPVTGPSDNTPSPPAAATSARHPAVKIEPGSVPAWRDDVRQLAAAWTKAEAGLDAPADVAMRETSADVASTTMAASAKPFQLSPDTKTAEQVACPANQVNASTGVAAPNVPSADVASVANAAATSAAVQAGMAETDRGERCSVCLDTFPGHVLHVYACGHTFHAVCSVKVTDAVRHYVSSCQTMCIMLCLWTCYREGHCMCTYAATLATPRAA